MDKVRNLIASIAFKAVCILGGILLASMIGLAVGLVRGQAMVQNGYVLSLERADSAFYAARKDCESLANEAWQLCIAKALAEKWRALAEAEVRLRNTSDAYRMQRVVAAGTMFLIQVQQCASLSAPGRRACDHAAVGAFREAMARTTSRERATQDCTLVGCPNRSTPPLRSVRAGELDISSDRTARSR